jgi:hypothetical protein
MTTSRTLPARPSLESLRKQAKKLARDIAAGDAGAIARARAQLPQVDLPLSHRNAQLVLAREYGFAGWQDLTAEVSKRLGNGLEWAAAQVIRAVADGDLTAFVGGLQREPWLFGGSVRVVSDRAHRGGNAERSRAIHRRLLDLEPALLRRQPPPRSQAIEFAFTYANTHLIPQLTRVWPLPDDLPHAAGIGDLSRVKHWFDASGAPALGDLDNHDPYNDPRARAGTSSGTRPLPSRFSIRRSPTPFIQKLVY